MDLSEQTLTQSYCRVDSHLLVVFHVISYSLITIFLHAFVYFAPNSYQLPFDCYLILLPPDGFLFAWELNYLIMSFASALSTLVAVFYGSVPFLLMNHTCWLIDMASITANHINDNLQASICDAEKVRRTNENLKKLAARCEKFVEWQNEVQTLLFWYFNLEFQSQSLILCLSIYVLSSTFSGTILMLFLFSISQLFVLCWMGARVTDRIHQLSFEASKNWYLMQPSQRKTLQMILHWTQNMKTFSGLFNEVNLETCKAVS